MLDNETKRRIDTARDILVGKVPDPKSQVEQITIALIYKFMDDMDAESEEFGGKRNFFAGEFARYGWAKMMRPGLSGYETLNLYAEAITKMPENPGIPLLFRDIFKNAYLPYRDPETLKMFLKIIGEFNYDHSENLGDAFEYLLSVLGSQGDAGQFRTPRHIIDFIVEIIDPRKNETLLDPACGTAGFLISAYKHIKNANKNEKGEITLTPDEKGKMAQNFKGYDISPDMVRLSLVNLYLHGFVDPHIYEYDTLTSQERWNEYADVIMANPPFMSPKGGIKPHNRFSMQSKRSEVLFVDYMAEHLTPNGRAGIIVPEGIIFQSQTAYKDLRKMLVENYLAAVVSLPAGVFNPYSGVKTSILILDKSLAKKTKTIGFFKVENDGFGLGAQRREIDKNDLPQVKAEIAEYLRCVKTGEPSDSCKPTMGLIVEKEKLAVNGEYNLSGERYRENETRSEYFPIIQLGKVCVIERGASPRPINDFLTNSPEGINWIKIGDAEAGGKFITKTKERITPEGAAKSRTVKKGDFILSNSMSFGRPYIMAIDGCIHDGWLLIRDFANELNSDFLYYLLGSKNVTEQFQRAAIGGVVSNLNSEIVRNIRITLPPIEIQKEIVAEIEGYQKVIDGARAVVDNYKPHIDINPEWPLYKFEKAPFEIIDGDRGINYPKKEEFTGKGYCLFLNTKNVLPNGFDFSEKEFISIEKDKSLRKGKLQRGDIVLTTRGTIGNTGFFDNSIEFESIRINSGMLIFRPDTTQLIAKYLFHYFQTDNFKDQRDSIISGTAQPQLPIRSLNEAILPLPPLATQQAIVAEIEAEQKLVDGNKELIERFEKKIQATLARVWGEELTK